MRTTLSILVVSSLLAGAFAGCLQADSKGDPTISRVHTLTLSPETMERADAAADDDPMAALRELLKTDIVVRVEEAGDYTLEFTDATGNARTQAITGATPGTPVTVNGADPIAPVVLKRGEETITVRAGISAQWWHFGDAPLGFNMTDASKTKYAFDSSLRETLTLRGLDVEEQGIRIEDLRFDARLPIEGTASWELQPDAGEGSPLLITGEVHVPASAGDLVTLDLSAVQNGVGGTAGVIAGVDDASATGSAKLWIKDGEPVAAQFLGASAKATPRVTAWADGFFADLAGDSFSCAGKSKSDGCRPTEIESFDESTPAGEKDVFDPGDFPRAEDDEAREAVALMERLFAQDIVPGDKAIVIARASSEDFPSGAGAPTGDFLMEFTIEAVDVEEISVPAGRFDALKILEETRTRVNVNDFDGPDGQPLMSGFNIDESIARTTMWLDATTYQPLKMEATTPFDADTMLKQVLNAIEPEAWEQLGGKPIEDDQWTFTAVAESSYELIEHQPNAQFSALVGLALAHAVNGAMVAPMGLLTSGVAPAMYGSGFTEEAVPARPAMSLALTSAGPASGGLKSFTISAASAGMMWGDLYLTVDGEERYLENYSAECVDPEEGFTACRGETPAGYEDAVTAGDVLTVLAEPGQTMRVLDPYSNSVIMTLTIA